MSFDPELYVTINILTVGITSGHCLFQLSEGGLVGLSLCRIFFYAKKVILACSEEVLNADS